MSRPDSIAVLSEQQLQAAFLHAHSQIKRLLQGETYPSLASRIGIEPSTLRQFVIRGEKKGVNAEIRRGKSFAKIYHFLQQIELFDPSARPKDVHFEPVTVDNLIEDMPYERKADIAYTAIKSLMRVKESFNLESKKDLRGTYYCYRCATTDPDFIVRSLLFISPRIEIENEAVWEFKHCQLDTNDTVKISDGMFLRIGRAVYLVGDVSRGRGINFLVFSKDISGFASRHQLLSGFEISVDHNQLPFFSKIIARRIEDSIDANRMTIDHISKFTGIVARSTVDEVGIDNDKELGQALLNYLSVGNVRQALSLNGLVPKVLMAP